MDVNSELSDFFKQVGLNSYEIAVYSSLVTVGKQSARELCKNTKVPTGRIYDVLMHLLELQLIAMMPTRPKIYHILPVRVAFENILKKIKESQQAQLANLYNHAKELELQLIPNTHGISEKNPTYFWSVAYDLYGIQSQYSQFLVKADYELLLTGFINKRTLKLFQKSGWLFNYLKIPLKRGVKVKILWSFEYDYRAVSESEREQDQMRFFQLKTTIENQFREMGVENLPEMKAIPQNLMTYYDIIDKDRVLLKLRSPASSRVFACMNILDPQFSKQLSLQFTELWERAV
jgi:sugar-specific transcriptional regulator TrmB